MKILVFSDSHRSLTGMYRAIDLHCPDQIIHLGDIMDDAEKIARAYPKLPVCRVPGNCDGWTTAVPKKQIVLGGASILLAHGHQWGVKQSYDRAIADARAVHADLLLFGHTHKALCQQLEDGLWMMNPGASRSSYGLVLAENGALDCSIHPQE
ncbi:MAG: YfcE family phosphodiesterase [Lawsonibacter sp.]|nr:YfcE family phosphodiesterase [Lawsonibacter sp.]